MTWAIIEGDSIDILGGLRSDSIDAVVCDPPAGVAFMGKDWDSDKGGRDAWVAWLASIMREALRVLKPGGHALVWALPRTSHWTGMACEDAGFEIREKIAHLFGSGFPKSTNLGWIDSGRNGGKVQVDTGGTSLKPGHEVWWLCRKPLTDTIVNTVWDTGVGGLQIDACRVATTDDLNGGAYSGTGDRNTLFGLGNSGRAYAPPSGRWAPNVVFTHSRDCDGACAEDCPVRELGAQSGTTKSRAAPRHNNAHQSVAKTAEAANTTRGHSDTGTAARFFPAFRYVAKAWTREREAGCEALKPRYKNDGRKTPHAVPNLRNTTLRRNNHPTVKPIALMRWLVRLVTPPGGTVLDPFAGSGTTGCAAVLEGFDFVGVELDPYYCDIARARISHHEPKQANLWEEEK